MSDYTEMNGFGLLSMPVGKVFTESDGEGSDGVLYVKTGNSKNDILVERLSEIGEFRRLGLAQMDDIEMRSTMYRVLPLAELLAISNRLVELVAPPVESEVPS